MSNTMTFYTNTTFLPALVKNPRKVLDDICDAVHHEDQEASAMFLQLLVICDYIPVIAGLIDSTDRRLSTGSLHLLGNLLAAETRNIAVATNQAILPYQARIFEHLDGILPVQKTTAYLLYNWIRLFKNPSVDKQFMERVNSGFLYQAAMPARTDLLYAALCVVDRHPATRATMMSLLKLVPNTVNPSNMRVLLDAIGSVAESNSQYQEDDYSYMFCVFEGILDTVETQEKGHVLLAKALFALSNLVVDDGAADLFLDDSFMVKKVLACMTAEHGRAVRGEATWVLSNAITKAVNHDAFLSENQAIYDALCNIFTMPNYPRTIEVATEALAKLDLIRADYDDMPDLMEIPPFEDFEYSESDFPCPCPCPCPTSETPYLSHTEIHSNDHWETHSEVPTEVPVLNQVEEPIPDAYTLILQNKSRDTGRIMGSAVVRGLVERLRDFSLQGYVPLDPTMLLTVADVIAIERLGYYISSSGFSVHPYIQTC
jgi:hypothetical protein